MSMKVNSSMQKSSDILAFDIKKISSHLYKGVIEISAPIVEGLEQQTISLYQKNIHTSGLKEAPSTYIKSNYQNDINSGIKNFLLYQLSLNHLIDEIIQRKLTVPHTPRLINIELLPDKKIKYHFDLSVADPLEIKEWKFFPFKPPRRKNYKDLDKQVAIFLKKEQKIAKKANKNMVEQGDWICFDAKLLKQDLKTPLDGCHNILWMRINPKPAIQKFALSFLNKKIGDNFITNDLTLSDELEGNLISKHSFLITIKEIVKGRGFAIEEFKTTFRLKNKNEIHNKLVEIFSYRNDMSQRKSIIEEMFHLMFTKHRFEIPKHITIRKQEEILHNLRNRPDYQVYKNNEDFQLHVSQLAEKILKEEVIIDEIAHRENIKVEIKDIRNYLSLFTNERLKEFVYFKSLADIFDESSPPIPHNMLKHTCRREKTLNYILYYLTR